MVLGTAPVAHAAASPYPVIASGLRNPRHLGFAPNGSLFVAESGRGGKGPCITNSENAHVCYGPTGAITEIARRGHHRWKQRRVVTGLPSLAPPAGSTRGQSATGPSDIDMTGNRHYVVSIGLGAPPKARSGLPSGFGTLIAGDLARGRCHQMADIAGFEARHNPVDTPDSNPASVVRRGSRYLVADAGGNTVLSASRRGSVRLVAAFRDRSVPAPQGPGTIPMQFVPTSVAIGPHHATYVSQLTGFPFPKGGAKIYRLRHGRRPVVYARGLTNVTDLAFARDGSLYAVEISTAGLASGGPPVGALVKVGRGGRPNKVVAGGLSAPYGVALRGGHAYVTVGSVLPGGGRVIRIPLH